MSNKNSKFQDDLNESLNQMFSGKKSLKEDDEKKSMLLDDEEDVEDEDASEEPEEDVNIEDDLNLDDEDEETEEALENSNSEGVEDEAALGEIGDIESEGQDLNQALSSELSPAPIETTLPTSLDAAGSLTMAELESIFKKYLNIDLNTNNQEQGMSPVLDNSESAMPQVAQSGFEGAEELSGDIEELGATYGHLEGEEILDSEFQSNQDNVERIKNKIENEVSYLDELEGGVTGNSEYENEEIGADEEGNLVPDMYNNRSDGYGSDEDFSVEDDDFSRNSELSNGIEVLEDGDNVLMEEPMEDDGLELPSVPETAAGAAPSINRSVMSQGMPIQIVLTGVMLTMGEINTITESVKKHGLTVKRIQSDKKEELNIIVEKQGKEVKINYKDISKLKNKYPFTTREGKFQSLNEALYSIQFETYKAEAEKENFKKMLTEENLNKSIDLREETDILSQFTGKTKEISAWNIKAMGSVNLKTGLNEAYSNILQHTKKEQNTLVKTSDGQFYLLKGNLKERSKVGVKKSLCDLEGKKDYGKGIVVGLYENTIEGMGKIMYRTKRTSLPLFIWKK